MSIEFKNEDITGIFEAAKLIRMQASRALLVENADVRKCLQIILAQVAEITVRLGRELGIVGKEVS